MKRWWWPFFPATYQHASIKHTCFFLVLWLALTISAGISAFSGREWSFASLAVDVFMLTNWSILMSRLLRRRKADADWTDSPSDIYRACRDAGFSKSTAKALSARASQRAYVAGRSSEHARALASAGPGERARRGTRTRTGIVLGFKELVPVTFGYGGRGKLFSVANRQVWGPDFNEATCSYHRDGPNHPVPYESCSCGFYAYNTEYASTSFSGHKDSHITVALELSGKIDVCFRGYRAQRAKILAIHYPKEYSVDLMLATVQEYPEAIVERGR